ncbi:ATP-dependent nuclease [Bacillus cereus group sp. MYBK5-1]|uniref:ATP-dependent nuclease n=1 Tax=Bacillus cereus group sp. MYBK5-1 TaxID=3450623 RepID=UPI003F79318D
MKLISMKLENYKSVKESGLIKINEQATIFAGKNNTGKTSLIEAIYKITNGSFVDFIPQGPKTTELEMRVNFSEEEFLNIRKIFNENGYKLDGHYNYRIIYRYDQTLNLTCLMAIQMIVESVSDPSVIEPFDFLSNNSSQSQTETNAKYQLSNVNGQGTSILGTPGFLVPLIQFIKENFVFINGNRYVPNSEKAILQQDLSINGENLNSYLYTLHNNNEKVYDVIINTFKEIFDDVTSVNTPINFDHSTNISLSFQGVNEPIQLFNCGSGFTHVLLLLCVLYSQENRIILFDEPHVYLHPSAEKAIYDLINETNSHQYLLTTHSPILINYPFKKNLYLVNKIDGISNFMKLDTVREVLNDIGVSNSDFALSDKVLFVEGPTEEAVIPMILNHFGMKQIGYNYRILKMGGTGNEFSKKTAMQKNKDKLSLILNGISESPIPYLILIDLDEKNEEKVRELEEKYGDNIQVLERREFENYLIDCYEEIAQVINVNRNEDAITSEKVEQFITDLLGKADNSDLYKSGNRIGNPIKYVVGSSILESLFHEYDLSYNKIVHGKELVSYILKNQPHKLESFKDWLEDFIKG